MILYNEKDNERLLYVKCDCGTHGIELTRYADDPSSEIYLSIYNDMFYSSQDNFFKKWRNKLKIIWKILRGKQYQVDYEVCLKKDDIDCLIKGLNDLKKVGIDNESSMF